MKKGSRSVLEPELFGPIFKEEKVTLRQAIQMNLNMKRTRSIATFVPDEVIFSAEPTKKVLRRFSAVLLLVDVSGLQSLMEKFIGGENGGCFGLANVLNVYYNIIIDHIHSYGGSVLKFTSDGVLNVWKVRPESLIFRLIQDVILCALHIHESLKSLDGEVFRVSRVKTTIAAGHVIFSVIGDPLNRHFVVAGSPVMEVKAAKRACVPGDLILASSAWEHCAPSNYKYVIKDDKNVKVLGVLVKSTSKAKVTFGMTPMPRERQISEISTSPFPSSSTSQPWLQSSILLQNPLEALVVYRGSRNIEEQAFHDFKPFTGRVSIGEALQRNLGRELTYFVKKIVLEQIEKDQPLDYLTEIRKVTAVSVHAYPIKCSVFELISLIDECYIHISGIVEKYDGYLNCVDVHKKHIVFEVVFGLKAETKMFSDTEKQGIICGNIILKELKSNLALHGVSIGISAGLVNCFVIGHIGRRYYAVMGPPINQSTEIASISFNKVSCDVGTFLDSHLPKKMFRSRGLKELSNNQKAYLYECIGKVKGELFEDILRINEVYPMLGRFIEMDLFSEILDNICVPDRMYSGLLIEGESRFGKSRLLDTFVTMAKSRQIKTIELDLHSSFAFKPYSVTYHVFEEILEMEDCTTIEERERILIQKLCKVIRHEDFCFINNLMRVRFPLSTNYCSDSDWERHIKRVKIVDEILKISNKKMCILLDNIQHMDLMSWQYLCRVLNHPTIVLVMAMMEPKSSEDLSKVQNDIRKEKKIWKQILSSLQPGLMTPLACQFLNVYAIPQELESLLNHYSDNDPKWCELFLMSILQTNGLKFLNMKPDEAKECKLVFSDNVLIRKIPRDLLPEEMGPPTPWINMAEVGVCLINENFRGYEDAFLDTEALTMQIFERMLPYELELIKCAATIGNFFSRDTLLTVMNNHVPLSTAKAVEKMMKIGILECASLRRQTTLSENVTFCSYKKKSFSDMQHLIQCRCNSIQFHPLKHIPFYAYCKFLEFKSTTFREKIYEIVPDQQKNDYQRKILEICAIEFRKCKACGGGPFLKSPKVKEEPMEMQSLVYKQFRRSIVDDQKFIKQLERSRRDSGYRRISILPNLDDSTEQDEIPENVSINFPLPQAKMDNMLFSCWNFVKGVKRGNFVRPKMHVDPSELFHLKNFSYIDYRNCQCCNITTCLLWKLQIHEENIGEISAIFISFLIQYGAALIGNAEPSFAIKILTLAYEQNEIYYPAFENLFLEEERMHNKGMIHCLIGNACMYLGCYRKAKKQYLDGLSVYGFKFNSGKCASLYSKIVPITQNQFLRFLPNSVSQENSIIALRIGELLHQLSVALMRQGDTVASERACHESLNICFRKLDSENFYEKCKMFLCVSSNFRKLGDFKSLKVLNKNMLKIIRGKYSWTDVDEVVILANVFLSILESRLHKGRYESAIVLGTKVMRISGALHLSSIKLIVLPLIIEAMMRLKRVNETVDLIYELYYLSSSDIDQSAITWYYALCMDLLLDAGISLESYQSCLTFAKKIIDCETCSYVLRDPESKKRLIISLWICQIRMGIIINISFLNSAEYFANHFEFDTFSQIITTCKVLECHLLILKRCINMKKGNIIGELTNKISEIIRILEEVSKNDVFVKSRLCLLKAYFNLIKGRQNWVKANVRAAKKYATRQSNKMDFAWIIQNERTWSTMNYNNMEQYWIEYVAQGNAVDWQDVHILNLHDWSTMLYPLPIPESFS